MVRPHGSLRATQDLLPPTAERKAFFQAAKYVTQSAQQGSSAWVYGTALPSTTIPNCFRDSD